METQKKKNVELKNPAYYNNRELSWLAFNERVLQEAFDKKNPLLERFKFLAIFSSNLDEFFMVRVAGLQDQVKVGFTKPENKAGMTPKQQLNEIAKKTHQLVELQYEALQNTLLPKLQKEHVEFVKTADLDTNQLDELERYFEEYIFPVLTPMAIDAYRTFPMLLNKSINLAVRLEDEEKRDEEGQKIAIVQVPAVLERFVRLQSEKGSLKFVLLEDVISFFIRKLFHGFKVVSVSVFRITRNADMTIHEEGARDLLKEIEEELRKRKWGAAVRLEIQQPGFDDVILDYLTDELEVDKKDVYFIEGFLDATVFFNFYKQMAPTWEQLVFEGKVSQLPVGMETGKQIFQKISEQDVFLHHPYESFEPVVQFISEAADDPNVLAIKQTLYRVSGDSPVIKALKRAAENGKQVTVLVELKARFDEENNVQWAKELEKAGCHVIYGMTHLKTHSKITLVVRKKEDKIERFVHLGTGNYNDQTAKIYTDMSLFTSKRQFGIDATNFFNYLSGYTEKPEFHYLSVAPFTIRTDIIDLIDAEIRFQKKHGTGRIIAKMNSLTDKLIIMKLYEASNAGVKVELIVRGICCLRPGISDVSENIQVRSIVGSLLEHSRIYFFNHNGKEKTFLSSADMMTRNLNNRIEILFPIVDETIKKQVKTILELGLADNVKARRQDATGVYHYVSRKNDEPAIDSQKELFRRAYQVAEDEE
ncbi:MULTISPECIES: RNA degradosome polyphosphate kinase [Planococcus]|uniref:Polyphosphate kinase n=1 Tax=Planococcus faecalis TaxID=1598147 RepID=A0ABN4XL29_9BACL|nr:MULTISPECIES: RNA degradosome polyphosphate kinase [Planococcus]AQU77829.1 RNA degradosome polyphosphate kinase [Planococcus faecalis]MDJ0333224.1 RNA degradosome polyphosphate kinase [Planococcus sp. S3-L1]